MPALWLVMWRKCFLSKTEMQAAWPYRSIYQRKKRMFQIEACLSKGHAHLLFLLHHCSKHSLLRTLDPDRFSATRRQCVYHPTSFFLYFTTVTRKWHSVVRILEHSIFCCISINTLVMLEPLCGQKAGLCKALPHVFREQHKVGTQYMN